MSSSELEIDRNCLYEALVLVKKELKKKRKKSSYFKRCNRIKNACGSREFILGRVNCYQAHNYSTGCNMLLSEIRMCIGHGNWSALATLIRFLLRMNNNLISVIWRASLLVLLYHEHSSSQHLNNFLEQCLGLRSVMEKRAFLSSIFSIDGHNSKNKRDCTDIGLMQYKQDTRYDWTDEEC